MWILTAAICPNPNVIPTHTNYAYCLAIEPSKEDHTKIINHYIKQIETVRSGQRRYWGLKKINTAFDLITYIADRPERQSIMHTLKEGRYGLRWGYASRIQKNLTPCKRCYRNMLNQLNKETIQLQSCGNCCNWDISSLNNCAIQKDK